MRKEVSRRSFLSALSAGVGVSLLPQTSLVCGASLPEQAASAPVSEFLSPDSVRFSLNLGTIRNYNLNLKQELEVARDAGYRSVEIWFDRLADYTRDGSQEFSKTKLAELKKFLDNEGLTIEGGIGFASWIVDEDDRRAAGLDELKRQAEALAALGVKCVAAPAAGANDKIEGIKKIADRFRATIELCEPFGVRPLLELWGPSATLCKLSDGLAICAETERDDAALLLDVYHLYRGGNSFSGLSLVAGSALPIFHMNDYPATPEREKLNDGDRVFPGDGVAPWRSILTTLGKNGFNGVLSFEIFNRSYCEKYTALEQAKLGLAKMRALFD